MNATASFPALPPGQVAARVLPRPVVFVAGHPEARLRVRRLIRTGPLNLTTVELEPAGAWAVEHDFAGPLVVALPRTLIDGSTHWDILATGRVEVCEHDTAAGRRDRVLTFVDDWTQTLERAPLRLDPAATPAQPSTLSQGLAVLSDLHDLKLHHHTLPPTLGNAPLTQPIDLHAPPHQSLAALLRAHGLFIRRRFTGHPTAPAPAPAPAEFRSVCAAQYGRRIALPKATRLTSHRATPSPRARRWIARGQRPRFESTFTLQPGWDPTLENQPDADYHRTDSSNFSRFANVYRLFRLNEDATLDGPRFDLADFFQQFTLTPSPIPFSACLTRDDADQPLRPIVEVSLDAGVIWKRYGDAVRLLTDRAGVVLDPVELDAATLAAAKNQALSVRVTASLTSPQPIEATRWQGNPFASLGPPVHLDVAERFGLTRVDPGSLHHAAVVAGQLSADQRDDTQALADWLLKQMDRDAEVPDGAQARVTLTNARPELLIGDRMLGVITPDRDARGRPTDLDGQPAAVTRIVCDFTDRPTTTLTFSP